MELVVNFSTGFKTICRVMCKKLLYQVNIQTGNIFLLVCLKALSWLPCLFIEVDDRIEAANKVNEDLAHIFKWSKQWIVQFSPSKTKSLIISNKKDSNLNPPVCINNLPIEKVKSFRYLGLHFT